MCIRQAYLSIEWKKKRKSKTLFVTLNKFSNGYNIFSKTYRASTLIHTSPIDEINFIAIFPVTLVLKRNLSNIQV